jgi:hypothetical protein
VLKFKTGRSVLQAWITECTLTCLFIYFVYLFIFYLFNVTFSVVKTI